MTRTAIAVAMALVVAGLGVGLAPAPGAATSHTVCDHDNFDIPDEEPDSSRLLSAGASEVGTVVVAATSPENLIVELDSAGIDGELGWEVKYFDGTDCVPLDTSECKDSMTSPDQQDCELDAPASGDRTYHVLFQEERDTNPIAYSTWIE